ncbi:tripartite tricarboxylate transporter substrate binding protein [Pusillimonas sp. ANT_WB101]|uniref:Bug family tripartite tricarboxylate transporter substrate binding protein n=1 Tax=Pusillimonas sp. ANT_WB101 TaxID=2597356 RepID=UPI00165DDE99|nr:tripartite tricarboxylate transporter substrate binding protein [Pusillimonas sp. ANT_WB101]
MKSNKFSLRRRALSGAISLALLATSGMLISQPVKAEGDDYPTRTISLVLGYPAGGINDVIARRLAVDLAEELGVAVIVENKAGANGAIAAGSVARSKPDGYNIMFGAIGQVSVNQFLRDDMPYEPDDLLPVGKVAEANNVLVINAANVDKFPDVAAVVKAAKADPGAITYASFGIGSSSHLSAEMLAKEANIKFLHVPYKGSSPAMVGLLGGDVDIMFDSINTALPHIKSGKIIPLAITKDTRSAALPDVPTLAESGYPDYKVSSWFGLHVAKGTPRPIIDKLNAVLRKIQAKPEIIEYFSRQNVDMTPSTPEEYGAFVETENARWGALIKELNLKTSN